MFGLYAMDGVQPFQHVMLHGLVRDQYGKKMSKSQGNVVDPLGWLDTYGADATRFTLARGAVPGADQNIADEWAAGSRNFCTKLWNASRYALSNGANVAAELPARDELTDADRWIIDRASAVVSEVDALFEAFQFGKACEALYHFVWDEYCDWYLELAKVQIAEGGERAARTRLVLGHVLDTVLRLLHPVAPFITDTLWTTLTGGESLVVANWPTVPSAEADTGAARRIEDVQKLVTEIRRFRSEQGLKPGQRVAARLTGAGYAEVSGHEPAVRALAKLTEPADGFTPGASVEVLLAGGTTTVELDLSGAVDVAAERNRLTKDLAAAEKELKGCEAKLGNPNFTGKAPADVVAKITERRDVARAEIERITARLDALPAS